MQNNKKDIEIVQKPFIYKSPQPIAPNGAAIPGEILGLRIYMIRLFECGLDLSKINKFVFSTKFDSKNTRYIWYDLNVQNCPKRKMELYINMQVINVADNTTDESVTRFKTDGINEKMSFKSGWGWEEAGNWRTGKYKMRVWINPSETVEKMFEIY